MFERLKVWMFWLEQNINTEQGAVARHQFIQCVKKEGLQHLSIEVVRDIVGTTVEYNQYKKDQLQENMKRLAPGGEWEFRDIEDEDSDYVPSDEEDDDNDEDEDGEDG